MLTIYNISSITFLYNIKLEWQILLKTEHETEALFQLKLSSGGPFLCRNTELQQVDIAHVQYMLHISIYTKQVTNSCANLKSLEHFFM